MFGIVDKGPATGSPLSKINSISSLFLCVSLSTVCSNRIGQLNSVDKWQYAKSWPYLLFMLLLQCISFWLVSY